MSNNLWKLFWRKAHLEIHPIAKEYAPNDSTGQEGTYEAYSQGTDFSVGWRRKLFKDSRIFGGLGMVPL